jgi:uncharacterized membrane protein (UPF0136 family)
VARHVDLLRILAALWGALAMLVGLSMLLLAGGAAAELRAPHAEVALAAGVAAGLFGLIGLFAVVWGAAHVWAAVLLERRRPFGRMLMLGLALVDLIVLPFGTALGIYALWVLLANEGRRLFEPAPVS